MAAVDAGRADAAVLLRPVTVDQISDWAHARQRMPPKSTYFHPKPRTGMVFRAVDGLSDRHGNEADAEEARAPRRAPCVAAGRLRPAPRAPCSCTPLRAPGPRPAGGSECP